jgi:phospholipid/cholesterol/gamma-HCH transport system substrate-binding protein
METEKYYFRVGLFFLAVMGILAWYLMAFGAGNGHQRMVRYVVDFDGSIAGLARGAPVRLKGLDVGVVTETAFATNGDDHIRVTVDLADTAPVREDTMASVAFQGITGTTYLALENTRSGERLPPLAPAEGEDYPAIKSQPSELQIIMANAPDVLGNLTRISRQLEKLLSDDNISSVQGVVNQTHDTLLEATGAVREFKMLTRTLREDPSVLLRGSNHEGYRVKNAK